MIDDALAVASGLERLCRSPAADRLSLAPEGAGPLRLEAHLSVHAYRPHRHDSYAVGLTMQGVQRYTYRNASRCSLPGEVVVLHPDEIHDGEAGTSDGLRYRMLYIEPAAVRDALGSRARHLPFVPEGHSTDVRLVAAVARALVDFERGLCSLEADEIIAEIAEALLALDPGIGSRADEDGAELDRDVMRARDCLREQPLEHWTSATLERVTGLDRFRLTRQFRRVFGTTPHRYLVMRRLELARAMARDPARALADIAVATGFADQAHLTRHFARAFGFTPGVWRGLITRG